MNDVRSDPALRNLAVGIGELTQASRAGTSFYHPEWWVERLNFLVSDVGHSFGYRCDPTVRSDTVDRQALQARWVGGVSADGWIGRQELVADFSAVATGNDELESFANLAYQRAPRKLWVAWNSDLLAAKLAFSRLRSGLLASGNGTESCDYLLVSVVRRGKRIFLTRVSLESRG